MQAYFIRRLLLIIPTFLGITLMVFAITRFVPGGPIERMIADAQQAAASSPTGINRMNQNTLSKEQIEELKKYYGFDKPVIISYIIWLGKIVRFDLGVSFTYHEPVWDVIKARLPVSIFYGFWTMILTYLICIPLGVLKAMKHKTFTDDSSSIVVFLGYAIPNYVVAMILTLIFSQWLDIFPLGEFTSDNYEQLGFFGKIKDIITHAVLPLISYMASSLALMTFMMKNTLMDQLASDYVRTAMAKGLSFNDSIKKHAFRNSLIPLATHFGNNISAFLMGSYLVEYIFNINGMGLLGLNSVIQRDYPVVLGTLVISSLLFLIGNILSDICVALVDPRIKFQ